MTRVVFVSEIPVAYRHGWFTHLREHSDLDVRVLYLADGQTDRPWEAPVAGADWCRVLSSKSLAASTTGFFARITPTIGRELAEQNPDFVLLPGWAHPSSWHAATWCRRNDVPYGVMFENWKAQSKTAVPTRATDRIRSTMLSAAAVALPVGERAAEFAAAVTDTPVRILHANVADVAEARKATADIDRSTDKRVLFLGRLMPHKGIDIVLDMAASLGRAGVSVEVAGDGPSRDAVKAAAERGSVNFHGTVTGHDKFALMARATLVVVPSFEEPWGVVVQEALACGTPVIASTQVGCATEFIELGSTGAIVAPERGSFEATVRSWADNVTPDSDVCVAKAETVTYTSVMAELETIVAEACA